MIDGLRGRRVAVGVVAWAVLALGWGAVLLRRGEGAAGGLAVLLLSALAALVLTSAWRRHNVAVYRRKGPRQAGVAVGGALTRDSRGRRLAFSEGVGTASEVVVALTGTGVKTYRAVP